MTSDFSASIAGAIWSVAVRSNSGRPIGITSCVRNDTATVLEPGRQRRCLRNLVERFFNKLTHLRRMATRIDTSARDFLAAVKLASIRPRMRDCGPKPNPRISASRAVP
jgi:hypothetical protein